MEGANSESTSPPMSVRSSPTLTSSEPPMRAASSAMAVADRSAVPCAMSSPTRSASQISSALSSTLPVRRDTRTAAFGTVP